MSWRARPPVELPGRRAALRWWWQAPDHLAVMPALARLPEPVAYAASAWRGRWSCRLGRDWAELSVGQAYVAERTAQAMRLMHPGATAPQVARWVRERYQTVAFEELEARWIARGGWADAAVQRWQLPDVTAPLRALAGRGMVVLQAHFNNPLVGCMGLARASGKRVWVTMSSITDHPQVHPAVSAHFRDKYAAAQPWLNGGGFVDTDRAGGLRRLYRGLAAGDWVVVMADLPPAPGQEGVSVPWLGERRWLAEGAVRLARQTGTPLASLGLLRGAPGEWRWALGDLQWLNEGGDGDSAIGRAYADLDSVIRQAPGHWWAAHLLPEMRCGDPGVADALAAARM